MDMLQSDSDWDSSSDSGSSEYTEEHSFFYSGQAHSILSSLEESLEKIDDFLSFEREFMHGDIVSSVADPSGQMGRVVNVQKMVNLENSRGAIIKDVDSKKLLKIRAISVGDYVVRGPWIGKVDKIVDSLFILFDDGSKCEVTTADQDKVLPLSPNLMEDSTYPYYPGQRVQVRLSTVSKSAWLCGTWKGNLDIGTVSAVNAGLVYVDWFSCALTGCDLSLPAPERLQDAKDLTVLSSYLHENWNLGDWCMLPMDDCKGVMEHMIFDAPKGKGFKRQDNRSNFPEIFVIVKTKTIVDVVWQDGSISLGLDSQSLLPINIVNVHEFWPGQFVLERGACDDPLISGNQKWGVVSSVDAKERTVKVTWQLIGPNQVNDANSEQLEEIVSAYELVEHPEFSFCYGDIVFKNDIEFDGLLQDQTEYSRGFLSCIGCVTGFKDNAVEVTWASGLKSKVPPNDIVRIDKNEGSATPSMLHEQNADESNQDIFDHGKQLSVVEGKVLTNSNGIAKEHKKCLWESSSFFLPQSTVGFFTTIAASIFGSVGSTSFSAQPSSCHVSEDGNQSKITKERELLATETCDLCTEMQPLVAENPSFEMTSLVQDVSGIQENKELESSSSSKNTEQFRKFDMVADCSDHHFLDGAGNGLALSQVKRDWSKKVQREWSILEKDLPETIYVRVYEERMDLVRAAIVGSRGTPYHDALFFFDLYLPPDYPNEPPLVHYRSGGFRVNPNLYESGKVCLSLLKTWAGTGSEVWNQDSSILQVLLSLQALVLNEKPYFNEAGYDKQVGKAEGEKNSISYNEDAFLTTWKSMLCLLRRPPKHFESLMDEHFRERSEYILSACKAYMEGAPVAYPFGHGLFEQEDRKSSSTGFRIMLGKLFPKLVEAFSDKGIDCSQFK